MVRLVRTVREAEEGDLALENEALREELRERDAVIRKARHYLMVARSVTQPAAKQKALYPASLVDELFTAMLKELKLNG